MLAKEKIVRCAGVVCVQCRRRGVCGLNIADEDQHTEARIGDSKGTPAGIDEVRKPFIAGELRQFNRRVACAGASNIGLDALACSVTPFHRQRRAFGGTWVGCAGGGHRRRRRFVSLDDGVPVGGGLPEGAAGAQAANERSSPRGPASLIASPVVRPPPRCPRRERSTRLRAVFQAGQHAPCRSVPLVPRRLPVRSHALRHGAAVVRVSKSRHEPNARAGSSSGGARGCLTEHGQKQV